MNLPTIWVDLPCSLKMAALTRVIGHLCRNITERKQHEDLMHKMLQQGGQDASPSFWRASGVEIGGKDKGEAKQARLSDLAHSNALSGVMDTLFYVATVVS